MFEQLVISPLWELHEAGLGKPNLAQLTSLSEKLGMKLKSRKVEDAFDEAMRTWLPLPRTIFRAIARATSAADAFKDQHRREKVRAYYSNECRRLHPKGIR